MNPKLERKPFVACLIGLVVTATDRELIDDAATLLAGGHTHQQLMRRFDRQWLINPGSVGMTFSRTRTDRSGSVPPWTEYAVVTVENGAIDVSLRAVPLDLERVRAQAPADFPYRDDWLAEWADPDS